MKRGFQVKGVKMVENMDFPMDFTAVPELQLTERQEDFIESFKIGG